jgi:hypothetical protein
MHTGCLSEKDAKSSVWSCVNKLRKGGGGGEDGVFMCDSGGTEVLRAHQNLIICTKTSHTLKRKNKCDIKFSSSIVLGQDKSFKFITYTEEYSQVRVQIKNVLSQF